MFSSDIDNYATMDNAILEAVQIEVIVAILSFFIVDILSLV